MNSQILQVCSRQSVAECVNCKNEISKKTPIIKGDENEAVLGRHGVIVAMRIATDPRPKCPHCYARFQLVIHFQNNQPQ